MYSYVNSNKRKKETAGPVDTVGRIENITIHGFPSNIKISNILVNHTKAVKFLHTDLELVLKLPLVKIDEDWEIVIQCQ